MIQTLDHKAAISSTHNVALHSYDLQHNICAVCAPLKPACHRTAVTDAGESAGKCTAVWALGGGITSLKSPPS